MLRCTRLPIRLINHKDWKGKKKRKHWKMAAKIMARKANVRRETEHCSLAVGRPLQCLAIARPTVTEYKDPCSFACLICFARGVNISWPQARKQLNELVQTNIIVYGKSAKFCGSPPAISTHNILILDKVFTSNDKRALSALTMKRTTHQ